MQQMNVDFADVFLVEKICFHYFFFFFECLNKTDSVLTYGKLRKFKDAFP